MLFPDVNRFTPLQAPLPPRPAPSQKASRSPREVPWIPKNRRRNQPSRLFMGLLEGFPGVFGRFSWGFWKVFLGFWKVFLGFWKVFLGFLQGFPGVFGRFQNVSNNNQHLPQHISIFCYSKTFNHPNWEALKTCYCRPVSTDAPVSKVMAKEAPSHNLILSSFLSGLQW